MTLLGDCGLERLLSGRMVGHGLGGNHSASGTMWVKMTPAFVNLYRKVAMRGISLLFTFFGHSLAGGHPNANAELKVVKRWLSQVKPTYVCQ